MKTKHKIQAFTLSEMIVVLILTSIIVGMAFSVLTLVQKHMNSIQINFNKNTELNKLEQTLSLDFNRYNDVRYKPYEDALIFASEIDSITYVFTNKYIVTKLDTFNIDIERKIFFFDGEKVEIGNIDAIKLETSKTFRNQPLFIFKKNDATLFLN
ncbi:MAG: prepilin-type N-terminal cleavage/methylation domain-containing protein [Algibacter sp.]